MPATTGDPGGGAERSDGSPDAGPLTRWRQTFPGDERQLVAVRRWLAGLLPGHPAHDDVVSVATELASNAIKHTASGRGGWFTVEVTRTDSPAAIRLAVADSGAAGAPELISDPQGEHGRGLMLVRGLAAGMGVSGDHRGRTLWADLTWEQTGPAALPAGPAGDGVIRAEQASLARQFTGIPLWYGRATGAWWALAGRDQLISASSPTGLAAALEEYLAAQPPPEARAPDAEDAPMARRRARGAAVPFRFPRPRDVGESHRAPAPGPAAGQRSRTESGQRSRTESGQRSRTESGQRPSGPARAVLVTRRAS